MSTPKTAAKTETIVTIDCPRCSGAGSSRHWHPDAGICYLCHGRGDLSVNIEKGERHLACLRREYRHYRDAGEVEMAEHWLMKGLQKRALVDAAKAVAGL